MTAAQAGALVTALLNAQCAVRIEAIPGTSPVGWKVYATKLDNTAVSVAQLQSFASAQGVSAEALAADFI